MSELKNTNSPHSALRQWLHDLSGWLFSPILIVTVALPIAYVGIGAYESTRRLGEPLSVSQISQLKSESESLGDLLKANPGLNKATAEVPERETSVFSSRTNKITAFIENGAVQVRYENSFRFDAASFVFALGLWSVALYLVWWSWRWVQSTIRFSSLARRLARNQTRARRSGSLEKNDLRRVPSDEVEAIDQDVMFARNRADEVFNRSTVLLISGIAMAIIGVAVFYFSLPSGEPGQSLTDLLIRAARPAAILFFLEAVAWFLLRQYRALSLDYKDYHDVASRRAGILASLQLARRLNTPELNLLALTALLEAKQEKTLQSGESTRELELEKLSAANPAVDVIQALIKKIPEPKSTGKDA
ncbi:MAG: hypothetical protein IPP44_24985 [Ideonella sp.]|nr:hypothetical protein [Ideonella sp.]